VNVLPLPRRRKLGPPSALRVGLVQQESCHWLYLVAHQSILQRGACSVTISARLVRTIGFRGGAARRPCEGCATSLDDQISWGPPPGIVNNLAAWGDRPRRLFRNAGVQCPAHAGKQPPPTTLETRFYDFPPGSLMKRTAGIFPAGGRVTERFQYLSAKWGARFVVIAGARRGAPGHEQVYFTLLSIFHEDHVTRGFPTGTPQTSLSGSSGHRS